MSGRDQGGRKPGAGKAGGARPAGGKAAGGKAAGGKAAGSRSAAGKTGSGPVRTGAAATAAASAAASAARAQPPGDGARRSGAPLRRQGPLRVPPLPGGLVGATRTLLDQVLTFEAPADTVVSRFFRAHPQLGHRDRGLIAEAVYMVLRRKLEFAQYAQSGSGPLAHRLALLGLAFTAGIEPVTSWAGVRDTDWLRPVLQIGRASLAFETRCNLPAWLLQALRTRLSDAEIWDLTEALNRPAPLDLRVNAIQLERPAALAALAAAGVAGAATPLAPAGIRLAGKPALQNLELFQSGALEVQDEGSQLLAHLVAPRRGELVIDFCAGAGGKTLALGALMKNTGRLYAMDVSAHRLGKLKPRLARSGLSNVHPVAIDSERDPKLKRMAGKADRVLVDAPCSGLGTLRRNPDLKWRQTPDSVAEMNARQAAILDAASRLVRPGGRLVYATCSLLTAENTAVVDAFLAAHPEFSRADARALLASQHIVLETGADLELWPHRHGTDGFYAAVLERAG